MWPKQTERGRGWEDMRSQKEQDHITQALWATGRILASNLSEIGGQWRDGGQWRETEVRGSDMI